MSVTAVGAYARIRKQFKVPIAEMGGVQEALARIASEAYILTSAQMLINAMLAKHEQPAVLSAVMKYQTTHRARMVTNDAMVTLLLLFDSYLTFYPFMHPQTPSLRPINALSNTNHSLIPNNAFYSYDNYTYITKRL